MKIRNIMYLCGLKMNTLVVQNTKSKDILCRNVEKR